MLEKVKTKTKAPAPEMISYEASEVALGRVMIRVAGVGPLLTHNPQSMGVDIGPSKGSRIPLPEDEAEAGCYRMEDGSCALKGEAFRASFLGAASGWKAKAKRTMRSILSHIVVVEELVQLRHPDGTPIKDYAIDRRRAIIQKMGIIRARPRFDVWCAELNVDYDPQLLDNPKLLVDVAADGGRRMGVGDYRPAKNGWFGRYRVLEYAIVA
jgi:hypothetical protein